MGSGFSGHEVTVEDADDHTQNDLKEKDEAEDEVDFALDLRHLVSLALRVHHDLAVSASVDSQPIDPLGVLQPRLTVQQLLILTEIYPALALKLKSRLELMQLLIRNYPLQGPSKLHQLLLIIEALGLWIGVSGFEVLLTIETGSFDKGVTSRK